MAGRETIAGSPAGGGTRLGYFGHQPMSLARRFAGALNFP